MPNSVQAAPQPGRYRKRPVIIDAIQWPGGLGTATAVIDWILAGGGTARYVGVGENHPLRRGEEFYEPDKLCVDAPEFIVIDTLEGPHRTDPGNWAIRGIRGEHYPCEQSIFAETYDHMDDERPLTSATLFRHAARDQTLPGVAAQAVTDMCNTLRDKGYGHPATEPGVTVPDADGRPTHTLRLPLEEATRVGLHAIASHLDAREPAADAVFQSGPAEQSPFMPDRMELALQLVQGTRKYTSRVHPPAVAADSPAALRMALDLLTHQFLRDLDALRGRAAVWDQQHTDTSEGGNDA